MVNRGNLKEKKQRRSDKNPDKNFRLPNQLVRVRGMFKVLASTEAKNQNRIHVTDVAGCSNQRSPHRAVQYITKGKQDRLLSESRSGIALQ